MLGKKFNGGGVVLESPYTLYVLLVFNLLYICLPKFSSNFFISEMPQSHTRQPPSMCRQNTARGYMKYGCRSSVAEHWLYKPGIPGQIPGDWQPFHFLLYFCLKTSKLFLLPCLRLFDHFQHAKTKRKGPQDFVPRAFISQECVLADEGSRAETSVKVITKFITKFWSCMVIYEALSVKNMVAVYLELSCQDPLSEFC